MGEKIFGSNQWAAYHDMKQTLWLVSEKKMLRRFVGEDKGFAIANGT